MKTTRQILTVILAITASLPILAAVEKEYTFNFSSANNYGIPTAWQAADAVFPQAYPLEGEITLSVENRGVRINPNAGYDCLQLSSTSGGRPHGCISLSVPDGKKIVYVEFTGRNGAESTDCCQLITGPLTDASASSDTPITEPWSDEEGMRILYFKRTSSANQTESAYIKTLVIKVVEEESGEDPENPDDPDNPDDPNNPDNPDDPNNPDNPDDPNNPDNPDDPNNPDNPDDPNNPDNPDDPETPAVTLVDPVVALLSTGNHPSFPETLTLAEADTIRVALYSKVENGSELTKREEVYEPNIEILDSDKDPVSGKFEITSDGLAEFTIIPKEAGIYTLRLRWSESELFTSGSADLRVTVYLPVKADTKEGKTVSLTLSGNGLLSEAPTYTDYDGYPLITPPSGYQGDSMMVTLTPSSADNTKFYYLIKEIKDLDDLANAKSEASAINEDAPAAAMEMLTTNRAADTNPATGLPLEFQLYNSGERLTLPGKTGYMQLAARKNGVTSPISFYYYAISPGAMNDIPVGVEEIVIETGADRSDADYYTISGLPADPTMRGILIRRSPDGSARIVIRK